MAGEHPPRKHAAQSKEARQAAKEREALIQLKLEELRQEAAERLQKISEDTGKNLEWLEMQFYQGGRLLKQQRAVNPYNAYISEQAQLRREQGIPSEGKKTIATLSREAAMSQGWKTVSPEEMEAMKKKLETKREVQVTKRVEGLHMRARSEYFLLTLHSDVTDTWPLRVVASARARDAVLQLYKQTVEIFALRVQSYITTGLSGSLKITKQSGAVALRSVIRDDITKALHTTLINERNTALENLPDMKWAPTRYEKLVVEHGVELTGWTEPGDICNPAQLTTMPQLQKLKNALDHGHCLWVALSDDAWEARKQIYNENLASRSVRKKRDGKGKGKDKAKGKGKQKETDCMDVDGDDDDEEEEEGEEGEQNGGPANGGIATYFGYPGFPGFPFVPPAPPTMPEFQFVQGNSVGFYDQGHDSSTAVFSVLTLITFVTYPVSV
ncbi:hypothetical protein BDY19DRAFT_998643 [Irpex rosettiformis]|uniref:Uncharacterized protein n=1 Tax=Irpex rosettiformis TaxID=378272 RepID=A0ACB8TMZ2_9APHY|nr:hypothetical protein BDY19DRAFT_998643 [Irpex rosettiformis]